MTARPGLAVGALGITLILGWGTSYFLPGVLGAAIEQEFGLPPGGAFLGVALLLGLGGLLAPPVGRLIDRQGARLAMAGGSLAFALGLGLLAIAPSLPFAVLACLVLGLAAALGLTDAANAALAGFGPEGARRRIGFLTVISGLSTAIVWPALAALEAGVGWRGAVLASAAAHLLIGLPLHLRCLPAAPRGARPARPAGRAPLPPRLRWLSAALTLQVLVGSAVLANLVDIVEALEVDRATAIFWASLGGPAQVAARLLDLAGGARFPALTVASLAMLAMPATLLLPVLGSAAVGLFVFTYGLASGAMSVMRPACLIELHGGTEGYASVAGRVMAPVTTSMAIAPAAFAPLLHGLGLRTALAVAALVGLVAWLLLRQAMRAR